MTVLEVNKRIEDLTEMRNDLIKLQNFFLGHIEIKDIYNQVIPTEKTVAFFLEDGCDLRSPIEFLMSKTAKIIGDEVDRLIALINETEVPGTKLLK